MSLDDLRLRRLVDVGRSLVTELDPETVLQRILEEARDATGARYAALGILNDQRTELERFLTLGADEAVQAAVGSLPRGRGVLGELIARPQPLRLRDVGQHARSYGFPTGHPVMRSFLGVPVTIRGQVWGNLYLTEKQDELEFTAADEQAAVVLADFAATAIDNARLYQRTEQRRQELERAVLGLEAARDIADAIGGTSELHRILELIVKRGRALVDARTVLILLREHDELVVAASAGQITGASRRRLSLAESTSGQVLLRGRPERIPDVAARLRVSASELGVPEARTALLVPMLHHGEGVGVLAAFDTGAEDRSFTDADEQLLRTFAASAANAVAISRSVQADRLMSAIEAADAERSRWARELHDETLQSLGALRVSLSSMLRLEDRESSEAAIRQAIEDTESAIENLRAVISDLRPSLLDDLGLVPAIQALVERRTGAGLTIEFDIDWPQEEADIRLGRELETTVYRLVQEALTNVVKHANASTAGVSLRADGDGLLVEVRDDGVGFDPEARSEGFGLAGMRERVFLADGTLDIESGPDGTWIRSRIALPPAGSRADQLAS